MLPAFLTHQYPLDKHFFFIPRLAIGLIGFYPETEPSLKVLLWALFNTVILIYGSYAELLYGIHYLSIDIPTALDALCPVASSIMSCVKMFFVWWYRAEFKNLIQKVRQLIQEENTYTKTDMMANYFTMTTRFNFLVLFFGMCTSTFYTIRPILTNIILYLNGEDIIYETPFKMM